MTEEMNPNIPDVSLALNDPAMARAEKRRRLVTVLSSEPGYYSGTLTVPEDEHEAHAAVEYLRSHARRFLGEGGSDIFSAQYLKMFAKDAAGKRLRIKIEMTLEGVDA